METDHLPAQRGPGQVPTPVPARPQCSHLASSPIRAHVTLCSHCPPPALSPVGTGTVSQRPVAGTQNDAATSTLWRSAPHSKKRGLGSPESLGPMHGLIQKPVGPPAARLRVRPRAEQCEGMRAPGRVVLTACVCMPALVRVFVFGEEGCVYPGVCT